MCQSIVKPDWALEFEDLMFSKKIFHFLNVFVKKLDFMKCE